MSKHFFMSIMNPGDPSGSKIEAVIPAQLIENYYKYAPVQFENLRAAKHVLENPMRIFEGIRQFNEGGWCFTGRPESWYIREKVTAPFPKSLVFSVYLNSGFVIYECRGEFAEKDDPDCPRGWRNRFARLIWKATF